MKSTYNPEEMTMDVMAKFERAIAIPENATAAQIKKFNADIKAIMVNPTEQITKAFEDAFNEVYAPEETPNEEVCAAA